MKLKNQELNETSYLFAGNAPYIEELFEQYCNDPTSISHQWKDYFDQLYTNETAVFHTPQLLQKTHSSPNKEVLSAAMLLTEKKQSAVLRLLNAYRVRGHQHANLDPIGLYNPQQIADLSPQFHQLTETDMEHEFNTGSLVAANRLSLREIINIVKRTYCSSIGYEYMHITETSTKRWFQQRIEPSRANLSIKTNLNS